MVDGINTAVYTMHNTCYNVCMLVHASKVLRCASPLRSNTSGSPLVRVVRAVALAHCICRAQTVSNGGMQREYNTNNKVVCMHVRMMLSFNGNSKLLWVFSAQCTMEKKGLLF
jgi:hypothetical protein